MQEMRMIERGQEMELYFPLILDGANGTELQNRGYTGDVLTETWVLEHPEVMEQLQREYVEAGSNVVYAPTFGANRVKLEENGLFNQAADYNRRLVEISREAAGDKALVAGDIATTGKFLAPLGDLTFDDLYDIYLEQASALEEAGVDMYAIETIMSVPDARAALLAVREVSDKPVLVSFTCDENGRTLTGTDVCAALVILQGMEIDAFGLNCSSGPDGMLTQFRRLGEFAKVPLAVKPNAGLPQVVDGKTVYDCPPDEFAGYAQDFADAGAVMFGGCCGTGPDHIGALSAAVGKTGVRPLGRVTGEAGSDALPDDASAAARGPLNAGATSCKDLSADAGRDAEDDVIICATEKDVFRLRRGAKADRLIDCGADLEDQIRAENKSGAEVIAVRISSGADIDEFEGAQYAVRKPLCIVCDDAALLEEALRLYQGRALYAGSLTDAELEPLARKYGLII